MNKFILSLITFLIIKNVSSMGVFELKLTKFTNALGQDLNGQCCDNNEESTGNHKCNGECLTSFRVCLKHYQASVDTNTPCTYGDVHTPNLGDKIIKKDFLLTFPFNFTWTGTFSLIVEAWHDFNSTTSGGKRLLARHIQQQSVHVGSSFVPASYTNHHTSLYYEYRVQCTPYYYGAGCEVLCRPRNDSFGHFVCSQDGTPECLPGWEGPYCTKARCRPGCNTEHGHCTVPSECKCKQGWTGELCDQCLKHPGCVHGTCNKSWECLCEEGWGGLFCNQDLNYCTNHRPCRNGGTCFNTGQGLFTCKCPDGYSGTNCEIYLGRNTLSCTKLGCLNNGYCDQLNGICNCPEGYYGNRCEVAGPCANQPCLNGGICEVLNPKMQLQYKGDKLKCKCPVGYSGSRCENKPLDCDTKQCLNGGKCVSQNFSRECQCIEGFFGKFCENTYSICKNRQPCMNFGTCVDLEVGYRCICQPEFHGLNCETGLRDFSQISRQFSENGAMLVSEMNGLSSVQIGIIVVISVLIPLIALIGALSIKLVRRRRELERKKADQMAKMENEANMITSGAKEQHTMIHNMLRFGGDTKFINNFVENDYSTIGHSLSDNFYETVGTKPLNTSNIRNLHNNTNKDIDNASSSKRLSRLSMDSSSTTSNNIPTSCTYYSECKEGKCGATASTSTTGPIYQSTSSSTCSGQSIYLIATESNYQITDDQIVPPGFFATEV